MYINKANIPVKDIKPVKVNFNLRNHLTKDKDTAIHCIVRYNNQKIVISSIELIKPKFWDTVKQRAKATRQYPEYPEFYERLDGIESKVKSCYRSLINASNIYPDLADLKESILSAISDQSTTNQASKPISYFEFIEKLIDDTKSGQRINPKTKQRFAHDTHKAYQNTLRALERFKRYSKKKIDFDTIDLEFYQDFKEYMLSTEKVTNNYFGLHIKNIKLFQNESFELGLHQNQKHNNKHFIKLQNDTDTIYLNEKQLQSLYDLELSVNARLDRVRDLFLVGCWTGLRFSDFNAIEPKNIQGDFIEIETQKTGERVVIPIHDTVKSIMKKYKGITHNSLPPSISNVKMNEYVKEVGEKAEFFEVEQIRKHKSGNVIIEHQPIYKLISTHTARRSFATNMHLMGVPSITIMAITGHKTEKAFLKYIKVTPNEHALKLKEMWSRSLMSAVN